MANTQSTDVTTAQQAVLKAEQQLLQAKQAQQQAEQAAQQEKNEKRAEQISENADKVADSINKQFATGTKNLTNFAAKVVNAGITYSPYAIGQKLGNNIKSAYTAAAQQAVAQISAPETTTAETTTAPETTIPENEHICYTGDEKKATSTERISTLVGSDEKEPVKDYAYYQARRDAKAGRECNIIVSDADAEAGHECSILGDAEAQV